jgi:hypothetical protein
VTLLAAAFSACACAAKLVSAVPLAPWFFQSFSLLFSHPSFFFYGAQYANDERADMPDRLLRHALNLYHAAAATLSAWGAPTVNMAAAASAQPPIGTSVSPLQLWLGPDAAHDDIAGRLPALDACFEAVWGAPVPAALLETVAIARARTLFRDPAAVAAMAAARAHGLAASGPPAPACATSPPPKRQCTGTPRAVFLVFFLRQADARVLYV